MLSESAVFVLKIIMAKIAEIPQEIRLLSELKEHPSNPNSHSDLQIKEIRHLIKTHGYYAVTITIQKSTNTIIKGHGVREALIAEGYDKALVNVIDCDDTQALAILVADNKIATKSLIDDSALSKVIAGLSELNVPALDFGFNSDDLDELAGRIAGKQKEPPEDFNEYDEDIEVEYECPKCHYKWSGKPNSDVETDK